MSAKSNQAIETQVNRVRLYLRNRRAERLKSAATSKPFFGSGPRLLLISQPERIPQSQIFPFHHYASDLQRLYGAQVREVDLWGFLAGAVPQASGATVVAFQTPFDIADKDLNRLVELIHTHNPSARLAYLDWFAPTDLRNAKRLDDRVDIYVKKHLLRDRTLYGRPTTGDTNLTDYYNRRFNIEEPEQCFDVPPLFMDKLVIGPSFVAAPLILPAFLGTRPKGPRPIDLHARFATGGTRWYTQMRTEAEGMLNRLSGFSVAKGEGLPLSRFMVEMSRAKMCFSPFGYGEVCWRDYESIASGAVLLKQDMAHVYTDPDIFVPWETYVPLRWDLADFEEAFRSATANSHLRERIADQAFGALHDWVRSDRFARSMEPLFG